MKAILAKQMHTVYCLLLLWLGFAWQAQAQSKVPIGGWQIHAPYQQGKAVALAGDKVYVAADRGLFYFDTAFNAIETITKIDGLSEQQISDIAYDEASKTLVVAYANTKVDLLVNDRIYSVSDIFRKSVTGEKKINSIFTHNKLAYISTSFGVVVLDLQKREVQSTYSNLGPSGEVINAKGVAMLQNEIYLATNFGILLAPGAGANLQDFQSWSNISVGLPNPAGVAGIVAFNNKLFAHTADSIYTYTNNAWRATPMATGGSIYSLTATDAYLSAATATGVLLQDKQGLTYTLNHPTLTQPREATATASGVVWVADYENGLVKLSLTSNQVAVYAPNSPYSSNSFKVYTYGGRVYVLSGGYDESMVPANNRSGFNVYENGNWQSYNRVLYPAPGFVTGQDLTSAVFNPVTTKLYLASYGSGLIGWEGPEQATLYNSANSPLLSIVGAPDDVRVSDVAVDVQGNVWVVNPNRRSGAAGLHRLAPDGTWQSYNLKGLNDATFLTKIVLDDYSQKWLSVAPRDNRAYGLLVFDEQQNRTRRLITGVGNGNLPNAIVYSMAKDLNGDIWVGTGSGVGVFYNPAFVFESNQYDARIPIIDGRPLLDGQTVRAIAVDGANRKWMGTDNGLWLFGPDGDELIAHYTSQNSPLPSNKVVSVAVEHQSGEVFVATDAGVASFRASATITEGEPACAVVFPNPVRPDYTGQIGISGLPNNADVRITDVAGTLVYRGKATGGTFAWNARDYNGKRVKAGVYLVLSASEAGDQTCISKIAVLQ
ncbi:type IX secretion system anionic LPS delivery protein PorZ [Pontibacter rugosus]|uniref:PorZ N-terminal beta-propeller domain-containing protein n=1 Tax=Pontibacter rugosus TaxID=1745966 RepID=A0ABW3SIT1_9BACT